MEPADITAAKNLKVEYFELTQKVPIITKELSEMISAAKTERDKILRQCQIETEQIEKLRIASIKQNKALKEEEAVLLQNKRELDEKLLELNKQVKLSTKELGRINSHVITAQEEATRLDARISSANKEIEQLLVLVNKVEETKLVLSDLQDRKAAILGEISTITDELDNRIKTTTERLSEMQTRMVVIQNKTLTAQSNLKSYTDQLYANMNDYAVIRARLEEKWKMTFPELDLPMM